MNEDESVLARSMDSDAPADAASSIASRGCRFTAGSFALILGVLIVAAFPEVVLGMRTFFIRDFGFFGYPIAYYHRESFWRGEIPLWNPLNNFGLPFLAQWNTMVLYPGTLIYLLFPLSWSLGIFCLAHQFLGGIGIYFLARRWVNNGFAASVAGLAFAFNGLTLNSLMWPNNIAALGWMPCVVLWSERSWHEGRRTFVLASVIGAMQMLTGAPEIILFTWIIVLALAIAQSFRTPKLVGIIASRLAGTTAMVSVLSAAQLLPFLDLLRHSQRSAGFADADWSMPGTGLANFLVPAFRYAQSRHGVLFQWGQSWTSSYYAGVATIVLAVVAFSGGKSRVRALAVLLILSLLLALGDSGLLYPFLRKWIPLGFIRYPIKFVVPAIFSFSLLAAFGVKKIAEGTTTSVRWRSVAILWICTVVCIGGILWFSSRFHLPFENFGGVFWNGATRAMFLTLILAGLVCCGRIGDSRMGRLCRLGVLFVFFLDFITHLPRQNPTLPRSLLEGRVIDRQSAPRHGESRAMLSPEADMRWRFFSTSNAVKDYVAFRLALFSNCNLLEDIPKINGFYSLYLLEPYAVMSQLYLSALTTPLLDFLGVSQISANGELFAWQKRPDFSPLATAGQRIEFVEPSIAFSRIFETNFRPREVVYLESQARASVPATNRTQASVNGQFSAHRAELHVTSETATVVVIAQAFNGRWKACVDGRRQRIWKANYAFQAVIVPAGNHLLSLKYEDSAFLAGAVISLLGLLGCAVILLRPGRHHTGPL